MCRSSLTVQKYRGVMPASNAPGPGLRARGRSASRSGRPAGVRLGMMPRRRLLSPLVLAAALGGPVLAACSSGGSSSGPQDVPWQAGGAGAGTTGGGAAGGAGAGTTGGGADGPGGAGPCPADPPLGDFREETIYFVLTTRFFDGDPGNNYYNRDRLDLGDPSWRGDFKGLIDRLGYIHDDRGFTALWITPVAVIRSGLDYHCYHGYDFTEVDPRLESPGASFQDLVCAAHAHG
ncbi:MAG: hypothetical protein HY744_27790, partial [Deltaproteobacteria bacterium]|nr:hypothetical protein [Deltaproteobacteria bacterium]